jgi:hypothetical protein
MVVRTGHDDFFGVLHSWVHEVWARGLGTQLREVESGFRYTPSSTFETFPFPNPSQEQHEAISVAAVALDAFRNGWLKPSGLIGKELAARTLTNLYNARPEWLKQAHERVDRAVYAAYGWDYPLSDEDVLVRLMALNVERAG